MATEALKMMKEQLMSCVQGQLGDLSKVDAKELGEAVDMIKDLSEAIYYCTITQAMQGKGQSKQPSSVNNINYYTTPNQMPKYYRDAERNNGYMYYTQSGNGNTGSGTNYYTEIPYTMDMMRDPREGRSALRRKMYMEGKQNHKDSNSQLKELQAYLQELSNDITEMIKDASPQEKATLHQKMTMLADKMA